MMGQLPNLTLNASAKTWKNIAQEAAKFIPARSLVFSENRIYFCEKIAFMDLSRKVSAEQLLRALLQLSAEEKIRVAEQLKAAAAVEKLPNKKVSFTVLKTNGKPFQFNRKEANER